MVQAGRIYTLKNQNTDTCLDLNTANGRVRAWGGNGGDNQKWRLDREGPGHRWHLQNVAAGLYLAPEHDGVGAALRGASDPYLWHISDDEGGHRLQIARDVDLHIDVENASCDDDTKVLLWERKGDNQVWILEDA
ncbi:RICIN domain-containing protein [Nonomuraea sp. NPDC050643]|uniref:RICIN domain-containing protein n=1 Tax=Nonomuraea sp. NPDC050643 TaxID=3155660 RepID=UPI0033C87E33